MRTIEQRKKLYQIALEKWGHKAQIEMAMEESIELSLAVRKYLRNATDERMFDLAGEIADVEIMIEQLKEIFDYLPKLVDERKESKLIRLEDRLNENIF
jgi:NTP pyrophosphatase (non-canonical NTP hydrolase)